AVEPVEPVDSGVSVGIPSQSGAVEPVGSPDDRGDVLSEPQAEQSARIPEQSSSTPSRTAQRTTLPSTPVATSRNTSVKPADFGTGNVSANAGTRHTLADTGSDNVLAASAASAALIAGGAVILYRRRRTPSRR
ncbi:LPXTG cell wall anchor domain-containing protein, partial [Streptomyces sp. NPDC002845]